MFSFKDNEMVPAGTFCGSAANERAKSNSSDMEPTEAIL